MHRMFKILLSNQYHNAQELYNQKLGLFNINYIPQSWTSDESPKRLVFSASKAFNIPAPDALPQRPVVFDFGYSDCTTPTWRYNIERTIQTFHDRTNHSMQVGFIPPWAMLSPDKAAQLVELPFKQNRYGQPNIIKLVQFIVCEAHIHPDWDDWAKTIQTMAAVGSTYNKPIYASLSPMIRSTPKTMECDRMAWVIREIYGCKFDGIILYDRHGEAFDKYHETILAALNQINE